MIKYINCTLMSKNMLRALTWTGTARTSINHDSLLFVLCYWTWELRVNPCIRMIIILTNIANMLRYNIILTPFYMWIFLLKIKHTLINIVYREYCSVTGHSLRFTWSFKICCISGPSSGIFCIGIFIMMWQKLLLGVVSLCIMLSLI